MALKDVFICFVATASFAVLYNAPVRAIILCGFLGCIGWFSQIYLEQTAHLSVVGSNFTAALAVALTAEVAARLERLPVTCLSSPAIVPLVPGFAAYMAMYGYVTRHYQNANEHLIHALIVAASISAALATSSSLVNLLPGHHPWRTTRNLDQDDVVPGTLSSMYPRVVLRENLKRAEHAHDRPESKDP